MSDGAAVLFANEAFYVAFATRDIETMAALWAEAAPVSCIHPGWEVLHGRERVIESWRAIFGGGNGGGIRCRSPHVCLYGEVAIVTCYEEIAGGQLAATNVFRKEGKRWRLIHHQAGPTGRRLPVPDDDRHTSVPRVVN